jgi:transposase InsO family protein
MMVWNEETAMCNKKRFIMKALEKEKSFSSLCQEFNISRECGYKWLKRYQQLGVLGLEEQSRKPNVSPLKTASDIERKILEIRNRYPAWGARKIHAFLKRKEDISLPVPSTINRILHRHHQIEKEESIKHKAFIRFEHALPNQLWQMDFKGHFAIHNGRCNPLTILDDHSRFSLDIRACANQQATTVKTALVNVLRNYGLPERMTMDNGAPWAEKNGYTHLEVWLIRMGIYVGHSRPFHPQTQGKDERFHRSLKEELLNRKEFTNLEDTQTHFDEWRRHYNNERPHEALGMNSPASRYQVSFRKYPEHLPPIEYESGSIIRKVRHNGAISYQGIDYFISDSMIGMNVKITESKRHGIMEVYLCHQRVKDIDLINKRSAKKII